jgi:cysteine-rich repeat protein
MQCLNGCPLNDPACPDACVQSVPGGALTLVNNLFTCIENSCSGSCGGGGSNGQGGAAGSPPSCGDGVKQSGEACDDGNQSNTDACTSTCKDAVCGDGFVRAGVEQCDDGNQSNTDACVAGCKTATCGDGFVRAGVEQCDDGNQIDSDGCKNDCTAPDCSGPGYFKDPTTAHCYYLSSTQASWANARQACIALGPGFDLAAPSTLVEFSFVTSQLPGFPGDNEELWIGGTDVVTEGKHVWSNGEPWIYGTSGAPWSGSSSSSLDCILIENGSGIDDGPCMLTELYLCERPPLTENLCRDGAQGPLEECDDGNAVNTDACTNTCKNAVCGDSIVRAGVELCDDGNQENTDACTNTCKNAFCGDGFVLSGVEQCDDGNAVNTDACTNGCKNAFCGDGIVRAGVEQCDDGNQIDSDGCNASCSGP